MRQALQVWLVVVWGRCLRLVTSLRRTNPAVIRSRGLGMMAPGTSQTLVAPACSSSSSSSDMLSAQQTSSVAAAAAAVRPVALCAGPCVQFSGAKLVVRGCMAFTSHPKLSTVRLKRLHACVGACCCCVPPVHPQHVVLCFGLYSCASCVYCSVQYICCKGLL